MGMVITLAILSAIKTGILNLLGYKEQPPAPPPSITISEVGSLFSNISCAPEEYEEPACNKAFQAAFEEAGNKMMGVELKPFIARITNVTESSNVKDTWDIRARVAWDQAHEDGSLSIRLGIITGALTLGEGGGSLVKDGISKPRGECLTSANKDYSGVAAIDLVSYETTIPSLSGIKEGAFVVISGGDLIPMNHELDSLRTTYHIGGNGFFGTVSLGINRPTATLAKVEHVYKRCL